MAVVDTGRTTMTNIDSDDFTLADLFKDCYAVPDFQREYVWEETHVEKLLQDVYDEFYDDESGRLVKGGEYFIGSIVTYRDGDGVFHLIDGQQRLTTSFLVLCVIRDLLQELKTEPPAALEAQIKSATQDPMTGEDVPRYHLVLQYQDSQGVLAKIAGNKGALKDIEPSTASIEHILEAYQAIREFLQSNFGQDSSKIKAFSAAYTQRVKLIRIITPNLSSALKLFETINDRGIGLTSMDLLKNLLFMRTSNQDYVLLKDKWKVLIDTLDQQCREKPLRFLRYYILANYGLPPLKRELREDEIYSWFSQHEKDTNIDSDPIGFVDRLIRYARAYANFVSSKNAQGAPNRALENIGRLSNQARQHFILLLAALHLSEPLFDVLTRNIENLFFCYLITREPTKNFERSFARWSKDLREVKDEEGLNTFISKNFTSDMANRSSAFDFALRELSTSRIQQYRLRYILAKLSQYIDEGAWGREFPLSRYYNAVQIEHILSKQPSAELRASFDRPDEYDTWKTMAGNLSLLERSINASVSNGSYEQKKAGYSQSQILLMKSVVVKPQVGVDTQINRATQDLLQFDTWTSEFIIRRQEMLGKLARRVWEIPEPSTGG